PTRPIGDALLDQRTIAGIGNVWKVEGCFLARIDPWRPTGKVTDDEVRAIVAETRPRMQESARGGMALRDKSVYGRAGLPCPRCGTPIALRGQGDDNRPTFWCPSCQASPCGASATRAPATPPRAPRSRRSTRRSRRGST